MPTACHVPPSWFHTTSTAYSTLPAAGLLHPATDPGVHPRFFRSASTCRPTTEVTVRDLDTRPLPSRRGSYPTKSFPRQQPYRITAAVAFLPFTPPEVMTPPVTPVAERPSQRRLETCSTSRRFSTDESVAACGRCRQHAARSFHGLCSPSRSAWSAPPDPSVRDPHSGLSRRKCRASREQRVAARSSRGIPLGVPRPRLAASEEAARRAWRHPESVRSSSSA